MHWFFGNLGDVVGISMVPDKNTWARVRSTRCAWDTWGVDAMREVSPAAAKACAARSIMFNLAGPCAQNRVEEGDPDWLTFLTDCEWSGDAEDPDDISRAIRAARAAVGGDRRSAWTLLRRVGRWTEQALTDQRVGHVVEALAGPLMEVDYLSGDEACGIMSAAGGLCSRPPAYRGKWRRRFVVKPSHSRSGVR